MLSTSFLRNGTEGFISSIPYTHQSHKLSSMREKTLRHTFKIHSSQNNRKCNKLYSTADTNTDYVLNMLDTDDDSINMATKRMIDSFWFQPAQILNYNNEDVSNISNSIAATLTNLQKEEFQEKFGERMGKRLLNTCIIGAKDSNSNLLGMVCIEVGLYNKNENTILKSSDAESLLKNAVASLKPSERRTYKNSSVSEITKELLPPEIDAVVYLSSLVVSTECRNMGLGVKLCKEAERIAKEEWEYDNMYLRVEASNAPARRIYEGDDKLGYKQIFSDVDAKALRVNLETGSFAEIDSETLILSKTL